MIFDALWRELRHGTAESPPECAQNVCRERPLQSTWTITNIAKPRFSQNLQKITKNQRFLDVIWVWLSQIEQESAKISRTHALGSDREMSARDLAKADEIEISAQKQPKCTVPWQLNLHIHTSGKWVFDYKRQDAHKGIDFGHQGGATCKFSGQFTVELVRTKNRTFHHRNLTKSIVLTQVTW